jgi:hypothetical protein
VKLFQRAERPPADIAALLGPEDRVLSWASTEDGTTVLASRFGLWWPETDGPRLIGWELISKATWEAGRLRVVETEVVDDMLLVDRPAVVALLAEPRDLPPTVRKRVEASVARTELAPVPGGSARFVARRVPGRDGVSWWARLELGTPDTEVARASIGGLLEKLRAPASGAEGDRG